MTLSAEREPLYVERKAASEISEVEDFVPFDIRLPIGRHLSSAYLSW